MTAVNGLTRRRQHRSGSLRDSPDEDGPVELPESNRLRDRGMKKERDRERDRSSRSSKRRRAERLMQGSTREEGMDDSSEESVNGEDDDDDDDGSAGAGNGTGTGSVRMLSPNPPTQSISPSISNHNHNSTNHRKIFPPSTTTTTTTNKVFRAPPAWKAADEMIGVSVPRKARSASTKRSHDCWTTGGGGVVEDQIHRQASTSPVRQNLASTSTPSPAPVSPSSSNASMRKKMKSNGAKLRPPKSSSKPSSNPEELEIEIAEVLYGLMTQSQVPPSDLGKFELNKTSGDAKSRVSSPISNSPSSTHPSASVLPHNSSSLAPITAVAPKRKRPRQVSDDLGRRSPINSKVEMDQASKKETLSPTLEKNHGSTPENGGVSQDLGIYPVGINPSESEPARPDGSSSLLDLMKSLKQGADDEAAAAGSTSPKKETSSIRPPPENHREDLTSSKSDLTASEMGTHQEKKFQIDLMAPPPSQMKSSPAERSSEGVMEFSSTTPNTEKRNDQRLLSLKDKEDDKAIKSGKAGLAEGEEEDAGPTGKKVKAEEGESERGVVANRVRNVVDLQFDLENPERETSASTANNNKLHPSSSSTPLKQQPASNQILKPVRDESTFSEKTAQSNSLPIPISMAGWPGGLPPMGYMAPLQGVVSMDGSGVATAPMQHLFSQPRPKRCATHCYVARNINYFQQLAKMNPFWPAAAAAAGTASIFGAKPCNLGVVPPPPDMHRRNVVQQQQDKSQGLTMFPVGGSENKVSVNMNDANQRSSSSSSKMQQQQVLLQQAMPQPPPPNNVLPGPAFIFPLSQQHSQAGASVRPGSVKSSSSMHSTGASTASSVSGSTPPLPGPANGLSFNYPNMSGNETQYLAILQNGYPFPIPTVGGGPAYRGTPHPQSMAYFNGPFYSSQMIHPSQFQQQPQQQQQQPVVVQQQPNCSSSSSQKHLQGQQQPRPVNNNNNANVGVVSGNFISFPQSAKDRSQSQSSVQQQQRQDVGGDDGPENRVARGYGQNLSVPVHHQNFALMNPPPSTDKKQQSSHQQQILKGTVESLPQNFAISFASMNGAPNNGASGLDISSAQNHAVLHNLPEATRHGYQMMSQGVQQMKNFRIHEEGKSDSSNNMDEEKKGLMVKGGVVSGGGQTIAFSRPEMADASRSVGSTGPTSIPQRQAQIQFQQQQQLMQLHKQQQQLMQQQQPHQLVAAAAAARNKGGGNSASYTSDRSNKFPNNTLTPYPHPQNLVQSGNSGGGGDSPVHSPQWKNTRAGSPQVPSSLGSSNSSSMKNISQQQQQQVQGRNHPQTQTQISFSANSKSSMAPQTVQQQAPINNHQAVAAASAQCPPVMVGSPTTSSLSKGASGSPRTTNSNSASNKTVQPSTLSSQQSKNSSASPSQKTSSLSGQSVLGNPHNNTAHHLSSSSQSTINSKTQNLSAKQQMLQPHLFFNPAYMQAAQAAAHPAGAPPPTSSPAPGGYYIPKRRPDQPNQQTQNCSSPSTSGMLSLCPVSSDTKGATSAGSNTNNAKGGGAAAGQFTAQSVVGGNPHPLIPPGFYGHTIPSAIQVKPPEQKQQQAGGK
ncbi:protein TIME FOR COFFEE-like isoform X2 [Impatiens glandulifera]|nr:protein TIME FOR COFFEE-like isoform X2 [Impatiens glandulifera]